MGENCLKRGLRQFADLKGAWQERGCGVFEWRGLMPQCTLCFRGTTKKCKNKKLS